jgi:hypothetical protein
MPYIAWLLKAGRMGCAVSALSKFRDNPDAQKLATAVLRGQSSASVTKVALRVQEGWDFALSETDLQFVLSRGAGDVKLAALDYAQKLNRRRYIPTIAAYVSDPSDRVADLARKVEEVLLSSDKQ